MNKFNIRIADVEIENFKNVEYGYINFENSKKMFDASILGLYGQNGSGKTALVDVLKILKCILSGENIPSNFCDYINVKSDKASIKYGFTFTDIDTENVYHVSYKCSIRKDLLQESTDLILKKKTYKITVFDEELKSTLYEGEKETAQKCIFSTKRTKTFRPQKQYDAMIGKDEDVKIHLMALKHIAESLSKSFIFSKEFSKVLMKRYIEVFKTSNIDEIHKDIETQLGIWLELIEFGQNRLFCIDMADFGKVTMNSLPFMLRYNINNRDYILKIEIDIESEDEKISKKNYAQLERAINGLNIVLQEIVPGLSVSLKKLGSTLLGDEEAYYIAFYSNRDGVEIPLRMESDGIKKIISMLQLLIQIYNHETATAVIDELDNGVFEYMLGELLSIISKHAQGQLIFTCHNLRPLETIDNGFIAFTTTNSKNRYVRLSNLKKTNNLRSVYYRHILLGEEPQMYVPTSNSHIEYAFRKAGECYV